MPIKRTPRHDIGKSLDLDSQPLKLMPAQTNKELVFAHASGQMPAQYAIMRNIMRELQSRSGWNTEENKGDLQFMDFAAGYGAGAWSVRRALLSMDVLCGSDTLACPFSGRQSPRFRRPRGSGTRTFRLRRTGPSPSYHSICLNVSDFFIS